MSDIGNNFEDSYGSIRDESSKGYAYSQAPLDLDLSQIQIRRSDADDCQVIEKILDSTIQDQIDLLFNYPRLIQRVETCFLSITLVDANSRVIGMAIFEDIPQGLEGTYDYHHENAWEQWLNQVYHIREDISIEPFNSLWLVYFYVDKKNFRVSAYEELELLKMVFLNVYGTFPNIQGMNFMLKGEALEELQGVPESIKNILHLFMECPPKNPQILKKVRGIHPESRLFYSPRQKCFEYVEIRIAKQEDHDDLAEIFNRQSEVLTSQFGEYFIAELIAHQNEDQKALVAQVGSKAVGLMSLSKDIDYKLLAQCFELDSYDNLLKGDFMQAIRDTKILNDAQNEYRRIDEKRQIERILFEEKILCSELGQRIKLQQYIVDRAATIKEKITSYTSQEEVYKTLTRDMFENDLNEWLSEFKLRQPAEIFYEQNNLDPEVSCWIMNEKEFFLKTLTFFGLPEGYINGKGHWHDWAFKQVEEKKAQLMKARYNPRNKKPTRKPKKGQENQKEEEMKPPEYFDLAPFEKSFEKFIAAGPEIRTQIRNLILNNLKSFILIFSDQNGILYDKREVNIMNLGSLMKDKSITISEQLFEHIPLILDCFGLLKFDQKITKVMPGTEKDKKKQKDAKDVEEAKKEEAKKEEAPKDAPKDATKELPKEVNQLEVQIEKLQKMVNPNDVIERFSTYHEVLEALRTILHYDQVLTRLGEINTNSFKDPTLRNEVDEIEEKETLEREEELRKREISFEDNQWRGYAQNYESLDMVPEVPVDVHNAIAINLFCIDEKFESRSIDFLEYAFKLYPDREYLILTQPHIVGENMLLHSFTQVQKKRKAVFDHVLYIFHRDALLAPLIRVRKSVLEDINEARVLYQQSPDSAEIENDSLESIKSLTSNKMSFTVLCEDNIIGFYVLTKDVNLLHYKSHFAIQDYMILSEQPRAGFCKIIHALLNPVFVKYSRYVLKELMRLANKTCIFFEIHDKTALPDVFSEMVLTRNRKFPHLLERKWDYERDPEYMEKFQDLRYIQDGHRDPLDEKEADFCLALITKKLLSINKINNNTRIVVVGASDTGISFIESLLSVKYINFPHIILLAPGGLRNIHVKSEYMQLKAYSTNYTLTEMRNLLLDARITVIDSRMVSIDRKLKTIKLDKDSIIPYDVLVLTLGLIDTQLQESKLVSERIGLLNEEYGVENSHPYIKGVFSIDDPYLYDIFSPNKGKGSPIDLLTRRKKPEDIMVYGRSLNVYCFINGLINRGVKPERIHLIIPPAKYEKKVAFNNNQERWDYEDVLVGDPPAFDDDNIEAKVQDILSKLGVQIKTQLELTAFAQDETTRELVAIKFKDHAYVEPEVLEEAEGSEHQDEEENEHNSQENESSNSERGEKKAKDEVELKAKFIVTSRLLDIDIDFFHAIHDNGLVYNGRLIVKSNFQTTDPAIFAAGRLCEFSQRYKNLAIGTSLRQDKYSGREIGQKLAKSILEHIGLVGVEPGQNDEEQLPAFYMPLGSGGVLPNDLFYYHIRRIEWARPSLTLQAQKNREDISCDNVKRLLEGHFVKFSFDNNGIIEAVTYMGSEKISVQSLVSFVGLSEKYLNKLDTRYKSQLIENVTEFLSENWAIALYHEWFSLFRQKTKMELAGNSSLQDVLEEAAKKARKGEYLTKEAYGQLNGKVAVEVRKAVEDGTLDFLRENLNHLPMYYIPDEEFK